MLIIRLLHFELNGTPETKYEFVGIYIIPEKNILIFGLLINLIFYEVKS